MGEFVSALVAGPMIGNEYGVGSDSADNHGPEDDFGAAGGDGEPIAVFDAVLVGEARMNFEARLRVLVHQRADATGLGA